MEKQDVWQCHKHYDLYIVVIKLRILYKRCSLLGLQQCWLKFKIIAEGPVNQIAEGKHYWKAIRLHKRSLKCVLRLQSEEKWTDLLVEKFKKYSTSPFSWFPKWSFMNIAVEKDNKKIPKFIYTKGKWILKYTTEVSALVSNHCLLYHCL